MTHLTFEEVQQKYERLTHIVNRQTTKLNALRKLRDNLCEHKTTTEKSSYFSGSYDSTAYTCYWAVCDVCNNQIGDTRYKDHGYYG